jgi:hypothetical protein
VANTTAATAIALTEPPYLPACKSSIRINLIFIFSKPTQAKVSIYTRNESYL